MIKQILPIVVAACVAPCFAAEGWIADMDAAKKQAAEQKKDLMIEFTGSDWCGFCIKMEQNAFGVPSFGDFLNKNFVLFKADFPSRKQIPEDIRKQNSQLSKKYAIPGYPTVVIISPDGKELTRTGFIRGDVNDYLKHYQDILNKIK